MNTQPLTKSFHRLDALDGLRGFAILLVFFSHIPYSYVYQLLPVYYFGWLFQNGVTGVTFLFVLSGFLMYYIYPDPASGLAFLQKRYTRIFPLFLTMAAIMLTTQQIIGIPLQIIALILLVYPAITNIIWTKVVKKLPKIFGTRIFLAFLILQVAVGLFYIFWLDKQPFITFASLPTAIHAGIIFLVNATLTLPLGQYVPMLDGVYWTLVAEVLFYCLYPFVVLPMIKVLLPRSKKVKITFIVCLFFLLGGIHMLSYKVFIISLIQPALFFYFVAGIVLAHLYKYHKGIFDKLSKRLSGIFFIFPLIFAFLTIMLINNLSFLGQVISPWVRMIFTVPIGFCIAIILSEKTILAKFFNLRVMRFLGTISYSLYLSHSLIIGIAKSLYLPTSLLTNIIYIAVVFAIDCSLSFYLFTMLEKPYFAKDTHTLPKIVAAQKRFIQPKFIFSGIIIVYLLAVIAGYQSKDSFNFFSYVVPINKSDFLQPKIFNKSSFVLTKNNSMKVEIPANANNFGLISIQLTHKLIRNNPNPQALLFSLTEKGTGKQLALATYSLDQFNSAPNFPFGFPTIVNAKGHTYIASFTLTNPTSNDSVTVNANSAKVVYSADKRELLTHPNQLLEFVWSKVEAVVMSYEAKLALILLIPFVVITIFLLVL